MRRSQESNRSGTTGDKHAGGTKKVNLEHAYGIPLTSKTKSTTKIKPVVTKNSVTPENGTTKGKKSVLNTTVRIPNAEKYGSSHSRLDNLKLQRKSDQIGGVKVKHSSVNSISKPTGTGMSLPVEGASDTRKSIPKVPTDEELDYEDDFEEDYQSDFEEVASTDEEDLDNDDEILKTKVTSNTLEKEQKIQGNYNFVEHEAGYPKNSFIDNLNSGRELEELETQIEPEGLEEDDEEDSEDSSVVPDNKRRNPPQSESLGFFSKRNEQNVNQGTGDGTHSFSQRELDKSSSKLQEGSRGSRILNGQSQGMNQQTQSLMQINDSEVYIVSSPLRSVPISNKAKSTFDFTLEKKEAKKEARLLRGKKLQGMIRLDRVCSELLHLDNSYEQFMFSFTGTQRRQEAIQTDNDKTEEAAQTDIVDVSTKWTQKPPTWSTTSYNSDISVVRQEALGVGTEEPDHKLDNLDVAVEQQFDFLKNWENLSKFISRASRKVLYILESEKRLKLPKPKESSGGSSEIIMKRGLAILNNLEMGCLNCEGDFVACSNGHDADATKKKGSKNIITVWSLKEPSIPMYFLRAWGQVSAIKIYPLGHLVASGNKDGSISLWDMDEPAHHHSAYQEHVIRTPSVTTSCMDPSHFDTIVGLGVLPEGKHTSLILSLDKGGTLIIWVCMRTKEPIEDGDSSQYKSAWSKIHLTIRHVTNLCDSLNETLGITAFNAWLDEDSMEFLIGTINGFTARGLLTGDKTVFQKYCESDSTEKDSGVICFDLSLEFNILAIGCRDKKCRFYEFSRRKRILEITLEGCPSSIKWSRRRSSVFYVALLDTILIWDLLVSDMAPWKTISTISAANGLEIYTTPQKEFTVSLASNELKISSLAGDVRPLSSRDQNRLKSFIALLVNY